MIVKSFSQRGFSLIEVLITVLILGTALLAISALQSRSLEQNHGAYVRTQVNILAYDILERVRSSSPKPDAALVVPDAAALTLEIGNAIPGAVGSLNCVARLCTVTITWIENQGTDPDADGDGRSETSTFTYTASI